MTFMTGIFAPAASTPSIPFFPLHIIQISMPPDLWEMTYCDSLSISSMESPINLANLTPDIIRILSRMDEESAAEMRLVSLSLICLIFL